jgi:hypothetical protein
VLASQASSARRKGGRISVCASFASCRNLLRVGLLPASSSVGRCPTTTTTHCCSGAAVAGTASACAPRSTLPRARGQTSSACLLPTQTQPSAPPSKHRQPEERRHSCAGVPPAWSLVKVVASSPPRRSLPILLVDQQRQEEEEECSRPSS